MHFCHIRCQKIVNAEFPLLHFYNKQCQKFTDTEFRYFFSATYCTVYTIRKLQTQNPLRFCNKKKYIVLLLQSYFLKELLKVSLNSLL